MKISDILQQRNLPGAGKSQGPAAGGGDFAAVLQSHLQAGQAVTGPTAVQAVTATSAVPAQLRIEGLSLTESAIGTLDAFSAALANPAYRSAELEPYISALEEEAAALSALRSELPTDDPLNRLLNEVAAVSHLEAAKYRRGDYQ